MKSLSCEVCGGSMVLDASAMEAVCNYCGKRYVLDHEDSDYYRDFFTQMSKILAYSKNDAERKKRAGALWESAKEQIFITQDETPIEVKYMYKYSDRNAEVYVARRNIIFHFKNDGLRKSEIFRRNVSMLDFPTADTKSLSDFFPKIVGGYGLLDGTYLLVIAKDEDEYPLRLFGKLSGRHVAWVVSRMENLCCVLEYNSLVHPEINMDTLYINPYTHQASLYGNWWSVVRNNSLSADRREVLTTTRNLMCLRKTAANLLGFRETDAVRSNEDIPKLFAEFLKKPPCDDAYNDFSLWDDVLIKSYGERKFIRLETDDGQLYKDKR